VTGVAPAAFTAGTGPDAGASRASGIAGAEIHTPSSRESGADKGRVVPSLGWLQSLPASPELPTLLVVLLVISFALLGIAAIEPGNTMRYRSVRMVARHQGEIAWFGAALLASVIVFFFFG
jgi:hypothetical protein